MFGIYLFLELKLETKEASVKEDAKLLQTQAPPCLQVPLQRSRRLMKPSGPHLSWLERYMYNTSYRTDVNI